MIIFNINTFTYRINIIVILIFQIQDSDDVLYEFKNFIFINSLVYINSEGVELTP